MRQRISATLTTAALDELESRARPRWRSRVLSTIVTRYAEICRRHLPELGESEWAAVCDVCGGWAAWAQPGDVRYLWMEVRDALEDGLAERHGIDGAALVEKLRALDYAGCVAAVDAAERYWRSVEES